MFALADENLFSDDGPCSLDSVH